MAKWKTSNLMSVLIPVFVLALLVAGVTTVFLRKEKNTPVEPRDSIELTVGTLAPDFPLKPVKGEPTKYSSLAKKVNVVNFWATWCGPCVEELPSLNRLYAKYKDQGLTVIGVNMDEDPDQSLEPFLKKVPVEFPLFLDADGELADMLSIGGLPYTVVLDENRNVLFVELGERDWMSTADRAQFEQWLGGPK